MGAAGVGAGAAAGAATAAAALAPRRRLRLLGGKLFVQEQLEVAQSFLARNFVPPRTAQQAICITSIC